MANSDNVKQMSIDKEVTDEICREQYPIYMGKYIWTTVIFWTVFVAAVLSWNMSHHKSGTLEIARNNARTSFEKDLVYRRWAAKHGGVYVPVTKDTLPNPYLSHIAERDITTPSGRQLTLVNPAYMTRQVFKMGAEQYGLRGHITSLNSLRPENAPDLWERQVLEGFEKSPVEVTSVEKIDGHPYMRLMKPLVTEQSCLKCHASQGYKAGDIRGGISVAVPMEPIWAIANAKFKKMILGYSAIWFLGLIGIGTAGKQIKNRIAQYKQAEEALRENEESLRVVSDRMKLALQSGSLGTWDWNVVTGELLSDGIWAELMGHSLDEIEPSLDRWEKLVHPEDMPGVQEALTAHLEDKTDFYEVQYRLRHKSDKWIWVLDRGCVTKRDEDGKPLRMCGTVLDITERKRAEEELKRLSQQNQLILNAAGEGIYGLDLEGNTIFVNPAAARMIGWEIEEIIGKNQHALLHHTKPDGTPYPAGVCPIYATYKDGNAHHVEDEVFWRKDGSCFPVEYISTPIYNEHGVIDGAVVTFKDITERKEAENALQVKTHDLGERVKELGCLYGLSKLVEKYDSLKDIINGLVDIVPPGWQYPEITCCRIIALDSEFKSRGFEQTEWKQSSEIYVNGQLSGSIEVFYKQQCPQEVEGPFLKEERDLINALAEMLSRIIERKQAEEALAKHKMHLEELVEKRTSELSTTNKLLTEEAAERKRTEDKLRAGEQKYRALIESSHEVVFCKDRDSRYNMINLKAAIGLGGTYIEDIIGKTDYDLMSKEEADDLRRIDIQVMEKGEAIDVEEVVRNAKGEKKLYLSHKWPTYDHQGKVNGIACFAMDITERKKLEEAQKQQMAQLAHVSRLTTAGELASSLAHELNQPLCAIATLSEGCKRLISSGKSDSDNLTEGIAEISTQATRAGKIIRRMGQFTSKHGTKRSTVDINTLINESIGLISVQVRQANVNINYECPDKAIDILADSVQLQQVLINLMQNGIDSMDNIKQDQRKLSLSTSLLNEGFVEITIKDNGKGFSGDGKEKIFEPFFTTKSDGMGIGLSISRSIIEAHGGNISAESEPGVGSVFKINLPLNGHETTSDES